MFFYYKIYRKSNTSYSFYKYLLKVFFYVLKEMEENKKYVVLFVF